MKTSFGQLMITEINEPVQVLAKFEQGKLCPLIFTWRGRNYQIRKVNFLSFTLQGKAKLYFFSVLGSEANYQLIFNSLDFSWRLGKVEAFGG